MGCLDFSVQEVAGPRGVISNVLPSSGTKACAVMLRSVRNKAVAVPQDNSLDGISSSSKGVVPKNVNQRHRSAGLSIADDDIEGGESPLFCDVEGTREKSRSNSPPRRRKQKGLAELGDSCPQLRRSARLSAKHPQGGSLPAYRVSSSSISITDTAIRNCNIRQSDSVDEGEPDRLWAVGKKVGLLCRREEEEVVAEYGNMEVRDSEVLVCPKMGGKKVSL